MAFAFFRKHQKVVMITMVVLMVMFLIPTALQDLIVGRGGGSRTAGTSNIGDIKDVAIAAAHQDIQILETSDLGKAAKYRAQVQEYERQTGQRMDRSLLPTDQELLMVLRSKDPALNYALLLAEARKQGLKASDAEVIAFKDQIERNPGSYQELVQSLESFQKGMTEARILEAFRNWLLINRAASMAAYDVPPSDAELKRDYRDVTERIALRVATISAEDLAKEVKDMPSEEALNAQFLKYRDRLPGQFTDPMGPGSFGFGYKQPAMASVSYMFVSRKAVSQAVKPTSDDIDQYYRDHRDDVIPISVPAATSSPAASAPATQGSQPASASAPAMVEKEVRLGDMTPAQARPHIIKLLAGDLMARKVDELIARIDQLNDEMKDVPAAKVFDEILKKMTHAADDKLDAKIRVPIQAMPLDQALEALADDVGVAKIAYPTGTHGKVTLNSAIKVTVTPKAGTPLTLRAALDQISLQLDFIKIDKWVTIDTLGSVLLPVPLDKQYDQVFPLTAKATAMMTFDEMSKDELLGKSYNSIQQGLPLPRWAFSQLAPLPGNQKIEVGEKGPRMLVFSDTGEIGRLAWRLTGLENLAVPAPTALATDTKLRDKVIHDVKVLQAMDNAEELAKKVAAAADKDGLEKAATDAKLKTFETEPFARKSLGFQATGIPKLDIPTMVIDGQPNDELRQFATNQAFAPAPKDVEPTTQGYGTSKVAFFRLPALKEVVLIQRTEFHPSLKSEYESLMPYNAAGKRILTMRDLAGYLVSSRRQQSLGAWFNLDNVLRRLEYKPEGKG